jgi:hypothetical protein
LELKFEELKFEESWSGRSSGRGGRSNVDDGAARVQLWVAVGRRGAHEARLDVKLGVRLDRCCSVCCGVCCSWLRCGWCVEDGRG